MNWLTRDNLTKLWPHIKTELVLGIVDGQGEAFRLGEINSNLRLAHFMAQVSHECAGGTLTEENLNYTAERLTKVWPRRFPTIAAATPYAHNPKALGIKAYGGRMGNADAPSSDGYDFRGRGLIQLTGRSAYETVGEACGLDLIGEPALAAAPKTALKVACAAWVMDRGNPPADADDVETVTQHINGGLNGLAEREAWLVKWKREIGK